MNLLLLGGMSPHNKEWLVEVEKALAPLFETSLMHEYAHWASAAPQIDLEHELHSLHKNVQHLDNYALFAKSAGVVLGLKAIAEKSIHPKACLFVGTPLGFVQQHGHQMDVWLKALNVPAVFVQNSHDPAGSYQELEHYLRQHMHTPHYQLLELPGDTHSYDDLSRLQEIMAGLLQKII